MRRSQNNFRWPLPIRNQKSSLFTGFHKHSTVWPRRMLPVNQETSGPPPLFECLNPTPQPRNEGNLAIKPTAFSKADRWKERCVSQVSQTNTGFGWGSGTSCSKVGTRVASVHDAVNSDWNKIHTSERTWNRRISQIRSIVTLKQASSITTPLRKHSTAADGCCQETENVTLEPSEWATSRWWFAFPAVLDTIWYKF